MAHGEALVQQAMDRMEQGVHATVESALKAGLAEVSKRLDSLEETVAQLNARLSPPQDKAAAAPKRGVRSKAPADASVTDVDLPAEE